MKLKYYLRGLGIGIAVTAIIMSFIKKPEELTDAQIKIRAAQLGMVEKSILSDLQDENTYSEEAVEENTKHETIPEVEEEKEVIEENTGNSLQETEDNEAVEQSEGTGSEDKQEPVQPEETKAEDKQEPVQPEETKAEDKLPLEEKQENVENYIVITVKAGDSSEIVSQKVFEAGLINSVEEYNRYLITHGYDRRLRVGNHEIPVDATEEEIAKILCGM